MTLFAITREAGPGWQDGGAFVQAGANDHVAFMNALAEDGFVLFAGPLAGSEASRIRVLVIVDSVDDAGVRRRLADDPWAQDDHLVITSVEPWTLFVGGDRLAATPKS
jgi:uncharacterized protein YciI